MVVNFKEALRSAPRGHRGAETPQEAAHTSATCERCGKEGYVHYHAFEFKEPDQSIICSECDEDPPRPDGPISGLLHDFGQQLGAVRRHAQAEGHSVDAAGVIDSYDRTLHPVMHGRRPHDLVERHGKPAVIVATGGCFFALEGLAFVAIALAGDAGAWPVVGWFAVLAALSAGVALALDESRGGGRGE